MGREGTGNGVIFTTHVHCGPPKSGDVLALLSEADRRTCMHTPLRRVRAEAVRDHPSLRQPPLESRASTVGTPWQSATVRRGPGREPWDGDPSRKGGPRLPLSLPLPSTTSVGSRTRAPTAHVP